MEQRSKKIRETKRVILLVVCASLLLAASALAQETIATIPVGASPHGIAVSPNGTLVYVTNRDSDTVSVIDTSSLEAVGEIAVGERPEGVAFSPDGALAYVTNDRSENISIIDVANSAMIGTIFIQDPNDIAVSSDGTFAVVAQSGQSGQRNSVSFVDLTSGAVFLTIREGIGLRTESVALTSDDALVYVVNRDSNTVSAVAEGAVRNVIPVGLQPRVVVFSPDGMLAYVTNHDDSTVSVIDTASDSVVDNFAGILRPEGIDLTSDGAYAAVAGGQPDNFFLFLVDLATLQVVGQAPIGLNPERVAITPDDLLAFVANRGEGTVSVVLLFP